MIETLRARLTLWYISVLAAVLIAVCVLIYVLLARTLYDRIDDNLRAVVSIAITSLANDLKEGQGTEDAARSTAAELFSDQQMLAIYDGGGHPLAEEGRDDDLEITLPPLDTIPADSPRLYTVTEHEDDDDRHRMAVRRVRVGVPGVEYVVLVSSSLEPTDEELESLRGILMYVVPVALVIAGIVGWFLARQSLSPVMAMAERARKISVENLDGRLPVANPRDELGRLAATFNELLARLAASFGMQRQFMADASHELRTPVATARTAAAVALQQPHRQEEEYRETLQIIEQQTARLSRVVDDMFTIARADAGNYPVQKRPMYLDEVVDDVVRAARILSADRNVGIEQVTVPSASFVGDEELVRRMIVNLLDNAVKHAPPATSVQIGLREDAGHYAILVTDSGPGIPPAVQPHIFERFYRGDASRGRSDSGGAGLGLAIARWIARLHHGDVTLVRSGPEGTTFSIVLPHDSSFVSSS
ncbi:MAG: ATP-binding protein [Vicinamibacterales bacterium]